jgi:hypothetical protein
MPMRHVIPWFGPPRALSLRFSATPPNEPPPPQNVNVQAQNQQGRNNRGILTGSIIAVIILLLLGCVALAPGFLAGRGSTKTSTTPTPALAASPSPTVASTVTPPPTSPPSGLLGAYYRMPTFAPGQPVPAMPTGTPVFTAVDPYIDFLPGVWGVNGSQHYPHPDLGNLGPNGFAIRWTGSIQPTETGTYTFYANSDDGVRVWVNNQLLIDNWTAHAEVYNCSDVAAPGTPDAAPDGRCLTIALTAGTLYPIKVEYYENNIDGAQIQLYWQAQGMSQKAVVPASALFHQP